MITCLRHLFLREPPCGTCMKEQASIKLQDYCLWKPRSISFKFFDLKWISYKVLVVHWTYISDWVKKLLISYSISLSGLTAIGIRPQWKRLLTEMQLLQFFIDLIHGLIGFAKHNFCSWAILYALSMIYLFGTFYIRTYIHPKKLTKKAE